MVTRKFEWTCRPARRWLVDAVRPCMDAAYEGSASK